MKISIWVVVGIVLLTSGCGQMHYPDGPVIKYKVGDQPEWAGVDWDDSDWSTYVQKEADDIFWARIKLNFSEDWGSDQHLGLFLAVFGDYDLYWDSVWIGSNGQPGLENENDKSSEYHRFFLIPDSLSRKGPHVLALRASQKYYTADGTIRDFMINNYLELVQKPIRFSMYINLLAGAFLITAIYFFILYVNDRNSFPVLLFSISSFLFFLLISTEYIKFYVPFHYSKFYTRLEIISLLTFLISFLIPLYFSIQFAFLKRKWWLPIYSLLLLYIYIFYHNYGNYDEMTVYLTSSMWISSVVIVGYGVVRQVKGALLVFMGLLINVFIHYGMRNYDYSLVLSFIILLLCMFYILALRIREQREAYEFSLVQTTRLKHELLKKKIQPHFLMNTLTSVIDWVEESPQKGIQFIEALAEEFDLLNQIEDKQLIPISQEIQLCTSHLKIMEYRKEIEYIWEDERIDPEEKIPPALIHTLLENGITHCLPLPSGNIRFKLSYEANAKAKTYYFFTYATLRMPSQEIVEGTGTKYVKARLTESYGNRWDFQSEQTEEGWKNVITIYKP